MNPRTPSDLNAGTGDSDGDHRFFRDILGAYAIGAVDSQEARAVAAHIAGCPDCRAELARLRTAVAAIPLSLEERDPPPFSRNRLESRLLRELRETEPSQGTNAATPHRWPGWPEVAPAAPPPVAWAAPAPPPGPVRVEAPAVPLPPPLIAVRSRRFSVAWFGWIAATLLLFSAVAMLVWNLDLRRQLDDRDRQAAIPLDAIEAAEGASATMTYLADVGVMVVALHGAPPPSSDAVYQLWLVHDGVVSPAGIFDHDTAECAIAVEDPAGYDQVVITREPGPFGSPSAVGPTILVAPIASAQ